MAEFLNEVVETHGKPERIHLDNGPEFISKALDPWAYQAGVTLDCSRPGKPTDNAYIEMFYNRIRRHSHLGGVSPEAFEAASECLRKRVNSRV